MRDDVDRYVEKRKKRDKEFAKNYDSGCEEFKIGYLLKNARNESGITQDELARRLRTSKSSILYEKKLI